MNAARASVALLVLVLFAPPASAAAGEPPRASPKASPRASPRPAPLALVLPSCGALDTSGDGILSPEEAAAFARERVARHVERAKAEAAEERVRRKAAAPGAAARVEEVKTVLRVPEIEAYGALRAALAARSRRMGGLLVSLATADADRDEILREAEYEAVRPILEELRGLDIETDADRDGRLSALEIRAATRMPARPGEAKASPSPAPPATPAPASPSASAAPPAPKRIAPMPPEFDSNGDGTLNLEERLELAVRFAKARLRLEREASGGARLVEALVEAAAEAQRGLDAGK